MWVCEWWGRGGGGHVGVHRLLAMAHPATLLVHVQQV